MFTAKFVRGDAHYPQTTDIRQATSFRIHALTGPDGIACGKQVILNPGQQDEHCEYIRSDGVPGNWDWAVIENAAGKTTEVVRP